MILASVIVYMFPLPISSISSSLLLLSTTFTLLSSFFPDDLQDTTKSTNKIISTIATIAMIIHIVIRYSHVSHCVGGARDPTEYGQYFAHLRGDRRGPALGAPAGLFDRRPAAQARGAGLLEGFDAV